MIRWPGTLVNSDKHNRTKLSGLTRLPCIYFYGDERELYIPVWKEKSHDCLKHNVLVTLIPLAQWWWSYWTVEPRYNRLALKHGVDVCILIISLIVLPQSGDKSYLQQSNLNSHRRHNFIVVIVITSVIIISTIWTQSLQLPSSPPTTSLLHRHRHCH